MSIFKLIDALLGMLPDSLGGESVPKLSMDPSVKEFFGDDAFSFDRVEMVLAHANAARCAEVEYNTQFLIDVMNNYFFIFQTTSAFCVNMETNEIFGKKEKKCFFEKKIQIRRKTFGR